LNNEFRNLKYEDFMVMDEFLTAAELINTQLRALAEGMSNKLMAVNVFEKLMHIKAFEIEVRTLRCQPDLPSGSIRKHLIHAARSCETARNKTLARGRRQEQVPTSNRSNNGVQPVNNQRPAVSQPVLHARQRSTTN
jgi:hypothetical protein